MILADTSAWVEYDRATGSPVDRRMAQMIDEDGPLAITEPVVMEVLAGARDDRRALDLRRLMLRFDLLCFDCAADFDGAVALTRGQCSRRMCHIRDMYRARGPAYSLGRELGPHHDRRRSL